MAGRIRSLPGGILALLDFFEEGHQQAVEADLILHGYRPDRMGTSELPWHTVFLFARAMASKLGSNTAVSVNGPGAQWTVQERLLNQLNNHLHWLAWTKSKDASRPGAQPPKPHHLPGLEPKEAQGKRYGKAAPMADVLAMLGPQAQKLYGDIT